MKKLMIAAAIVCAAAISQAATVSWTSSAKILGIADATYAAGLANGDYSANGKAVTTSGYQTYCTGSLAYVLTLTYDLGEGTVETSYTGKLAKNSGLGGTGKISSTVTDALFDEINRGTAYTYALKLTDTGTDGKGVEFTQTTTINGSDKTPASGDITLSVGAPSTWTVTVAPEPTSGLLLLLGMAGLALKRKRA